jgi:hypothetical protein
MQLTTNAVARSSRNRDPKKLATDETRMKHGKMQGWAFFVF